MVASLVGVITLVVLGGWHSRNRRHPNWPVASDARFYITIGYPAVAIAVYWLMTSPTTTGLDWALGNLWALSAMMSFVYGFSALNAESERQDLVTCAIESIVDPQDGSVCASAGHHLLDRLQHDD